MGILQSRKVGYLGLVAVMLLNGVMCNKRKEMQTHCMLTGMLDWKRVLSEQQHRIVLRCCETVIIMQLLTDNNSSYTADAKVYWSVNVR